VDTGRSHVQDMAPVPAMEMPVLNFVAQPLPRSSLPYGHHGADPKEEWNHTLEIMLNHRMGKV
jgi:hypothetical protein